MQDLRFKHQEATTKLETIEGALDKVIGSSTRELKTSFVLQAYKEKLELERAKAEAENRANSAVTAAELMAQDGLKAKLDRQGKEAARVQEQLELEVTLRTVRHC